MLQKPDFGQIFALESSDFGLIVKYKSLKEVLELFGAVNVRESLVVKELFDFKQEEHVVVSFSSEYPIVHKLDVNIGFTQLLLMLHDY